MATINIPDPALALHSAGWHGALALAELQAHPELWGHSDLRRAFPSSPHTEATDIFLRWQDMTSYYLYGDLSFLENLTCRLTPQGKILQKVCNLATLVCMELRAERIGRAILTKLPPGGSISPHIDHGSYAKHYQRFQLSLASGPGNLFRCGPAETSFAPGELWWFDTQQTHSVDAGASERIVLILDIETNWRPSHD